jgi:hypothetical protein
MTKPSDLDKLSAEAREGIGALRSRVIRRANVALPHDYIVPSGVYEEQWDWDAFFVGLYLISADRAGSISRTGVWISSATLSPTDRLQEEFGPGLAAMPVSTTSSRSWCL